MISAVVRDDAHSVADDAPAQFQDLASLTHYVTTGGVNDRVQHCAGSTALELRANLPRPVLCAPSIFPHSVYFGSVRTVFVVRPALCTERQGAGELFRAATRYIHVRANRDADL